MSEVAPGWEAWARAEARIETDGIDAACEGLTPRLAWLLRATHAAWVGDRDTLESLGDETVIPFTGWFLDDAILDGDADPTRVRAQAKRSGATNKPFPFLDLLRLVTVSINGERRASAAPTLKAYARQTAVLHGATMGLHSAFKAYRSEELLARRSPRFTSAWAAAVLRQMRAKNVAEEMARIFPEMPPLPAELWPDLDDYRAEYKGERLGIGEITTLEDFLRQPLRHEWVAPLAHDPAIRYPESPVAGERTLGQMLDAARVLAGAGRLYALGQLLDSAVGLANSVGRQDIAEAALWIHLRAALLSGPSEAYVIDGAWHEFEHIPEKDRAPIVKELATRIVREEIEPRFLGEILPAAFAAGWGEDLGIELLAGLVTDLSTREQRRALEAMGPERRTPVEAEIQLVKRNFGAAFDVAARGWIASGADHRTRDQLRRTMCTAIEQTGMGESTTPRVRKDLVRRIQFFLQSAAKAEVTVPAGLVSMFHDMALIEGKGTPAKGVAKDIAAHLERGLARDTFEGEETMVHGRLKVCYALHGAEAAGDQLKLYGRWLRQAPATLGVRSALATAVQVAALLEVVREMGAAVTRDARDAQTFESWLAPLHSYLLHAGQEAVAAAAARLHHDRDVDADHTLDWLETDAPEGIDGPAWEAVDRLSDGGDGLGMLDDLPDGFLSGLLGGLEDLDPGALEALLGRP